MSEPKRSSDEVGASHDVASEREAAVLDVKKYLRSMDLGKVMEAITSHGLSFKDLGIENTDYALENSFGMALCRGELSVLEQADTFFSFPWAKTSLSIKARATEGVAVLLKKFDLDGATQFAEYGERLSRPRPEQNVIKRRGNHWSVLESGIQMAMRMALESKERQLIDFLVTIPGWSRGMLLFDVAENLIRNSLTSQLGEKEDLGIVEYVQSITELANLPVKIRFQAIKSAMERKLLSGVTFSIESIEQFISLGHSLLSEAEQHVVFLEMIEWCLTGGTGKLEFSSVKALALLLQAVSFQEDDLDALYYRTTGAVQSDFRERERGWEQVDRVMQDEPFIFDEHALREKPELAKTILFIYDQALSEKRYTEAFEYGGTWNIPPETLRALGRPYRSDVIKKSIEFYRNDGLNMEFDPLDTIGLSWKDISRKEIPLSACTDRLRDPRVNRLLLNDPWQETLIKLLRLQGRVQNEAHDPWLTEMDPLYTSLIQTGVIDRESGEDGELLVGFVREFGMVNLPKTVELYCVLKRGKMFEELSAVQQSQLTETIGKRVANMKPEQIINELRLMPHRIQTAVLEDKIPLTLQTELGEEMFAVLKGHTAWERHDSLATVVDVLKTARAEGRNVGVPREYWNEAGEKIIERSVVVSTMMRRERSHEEMAGRHALVEGILVREEDGKETELGVFLRQFEKALDEAISIDVRHLDVNSSEDADRLRAYSLALVLSDAENGGWNHQINAMRHLRLETEKDIEALRDVFVDFLFEHAFVDLKKFFRDSDQMVSQIYQAWGQTQEITKHILERTTTRIRRIDRDVLVANGRSTTVHFVPAHGILRIYSGDIGDACFTRQHLELANGAVSNLHALLFVTGRGKGNETIRGSALLIETMTASDIEGFEPERVLLLRANNPQKNFLTTVDADAFIEQTIEQTIEIAKARGFDMVCVPLDGASNSCSNREEVALYYRRHFRENEKIMLKNEPATNFNGYVNWDANGDHPVVMIWKKS